MSIKSLTAAVAVAAGLFASNNNANAQVIVSSGYSTPGVVYTSGYTPVYSNYTIPSHGVIVSNGTTYPYGSGVYSNPYNMGYYGGYYGSPYNTGYYNGLTGTSYYNNVLANPYSNAYYSGYNNLYNGGLGGVGVGTSGITFGGRRIGRW